MFSRPLKCIFLLAIFFGAHAVVPLWAAINLISVEHRVWGDAGHSPASYYDETGYVSLSRNISNDGLNGAGYYASSTASDWSVTAFREGDASYCNGFAQNTYVFNPLSQQLSIILVGGVGIWWFENEARMTLTDLSTDSIVSLYQSPSYLSQQGLSQTDDQLTDYAITWDTTVEVNPEHQYELILFVGAHRGEGGPGSAALNLTLLPEPSATMLVSFAALLACSRRQRTPARHSPHVPV